jgi:hypothetical protein
MEVVAENCWRGRHDLRARTNAEKKSIAQRPQRLRRGMEVVAEIVGGDTMGCGREPTPKRLHRTEVMKV